MELAYQEIQRRDAQAEQRAWRKDTLVQRLGLVIVALAGVLVWLVVTKHQVQAFVQTVQVTDEGRLVQLGVPQDLYAYTPPEGVYMEMVAQWVRWTRWRGDDERMTAGAVGLGVPAYAVASRTPGSRPWRRKRSRLSRAASGWRWTSRVSPRLPRPDSYQVLWEEHLTEKTAPPCKTQLWTGTFTVGRTTLTTMDDLLDNRLASVSPAYDIDPKST